MAKGILPFLAVAAVAGPSAAAAATPTFDDGFVVINLNNEVRSQSGTKPAKVDYSPAVRLRLFGVDSGDAVRVTWKKGRKKLLEKRCPLRVRGTVGSLAISDRCWTRDAKMTAHGALTAEVRFVDDSEEKETLVRTLKVQVGRFWRIDRVLRGRPVHSPRYQVVGSDLMGLAYAWHAEPGDVEAFGDLYFYFWATLANDRSNLDDPSWRCKRDGKAVPEMNVDGTKVIESIADIKEQDVQYKSKKWQSSWYAWRLMWIKPQLIWGKRNPKAPSTVSSNRYNISKHPGRYACRLRNRGETIREFDFVVGANGMIPAHGAQGPGGLTLRPGASFVSMAIKKTNTESSFDQKAARRSVVFGRSWPKGKDVKDLLKSMPRSFGSAVPKKPRGAR